MNYLFLCSADGQNVPSEILRYNVSSGSYQHLQYLPTKSPSDLCFFRLGSRPDEMEFYLLAVNQFSFSDARHGIGSHIYKWSRGRFEPFQVVAVSGATGCHAAQQGTAGDEGQLLALILSTPSGSVALQYDGWRFVPSVQYSQHALGPGVRQMGSYTSDDGQLYLNVANENPDLSSPDNLFVMPFTRSPPDGPPISSVIYENSLARCLETGSRLSANPINTIIDLYSLAVKKNDTEVRLGRVTFDKQLEVQNVSTNQVDVKLNATHLGAEQIVRLQKLSTKIDGLAGRLDSAKDRAARSIVNNRGGDYLIQGPVHFHSLAAIELQANQATITRINSVDVNQLYSKAVVASDGLERINSSIRVGQLDVDFHIETEWLSGSPDIAYLQADEDFFIDPNVVVHVDGDLRIIDGDLVVVGLVDGVSVSSSDLLLRDGNQLLNWTLKVDGEVRIMKKLDVETINGQDVDQLYEKALQTSANLTLSRPFFSSISCGAKDSNVLVTGLINGINLTELDEKAMKLSGNQVVTGQHIYETAHLRKVTLLGLLNGHKFPDDFITVLPDDVLPIKEILLTSNHSAFGQLQVSEKAAGLNVTNGRLSTGNWLNKTDTRPVVVTGQKSFSDVHSAGQVTSATINGKPMEHFETNSSIYGNPQVSITFGMHPSYNFI